MNLVNPKHPSDSTVRGNLAANNMGRLRALAKEINQKALERKLFLTLRDGGVGTTKIEIQALKLVEEGKSEISIMANKFNKITNGNIKHTRVLFLNKGNSAITTKYDLILDLLEREGVNLAGLGESNFNITDPDHIKLFDDYNIENKLITYNNITSNIARITALIKKGLTYE